MKPVEEADQDCGTGTVGKAMLLLELVAMADRPLRLTEILHSCGQPRGSLHRQLRHLVAEGLLRQRPDLSYEPGLRLLKLAHKAWARNDLRSLASPYLDKLHAATGETVHVGMLLDTEIVYLDKMESRQTVTMISRIGQAAPAYCTGLGKAALSSLLPERLETVLSRIVFQPFTPNTHLDRSSLLTELETIRQCGYAFDREEHEKEIRCVAAPVFDGQRNLVGGISVTGPAYRVSMDSLEAWAPVVRAAARALNDELFTALSPSARRLPSKS
ncbi:IclR family transcriptional regulator [Xaviernesmea oryzae]|uniref:IclR family transcriptional regulator n=1 Tax=Xaviernesmea oryzae TaxID=464029 RepID=A0A1Q9ATS1_9HYPH|nr:IclR family transcriptional regulator [Xaviernesmea oryzae]OLP58735.1 IclR family transcriptional regulator [Xaviernesmea oryzae]SEK70674.1 transcriptional regulator, IclR family [Xaviernesmea oryzae]